MRFGAGLCRLPAIMQVGPEAGGRPTLLPAIARSSNAIALVGIAIAVVALAAFAIYESANRRERDIQARQLITTLAATLAEEAGRILDVANLVAERAIDLSRDRDWDEIAASRAIHTDFTRWSNAYDFISAVWLVDAAGRPRQTNRAFPAPDVSVADREHFVVHRDRDAGPYLSPLIRSRVASEANIVFTRRIDDAQGKFRGAALVVLNPDHFLRLYREILVELPVTVELVRFDRSILIRSPAPDTDAVVNTKKTTGPQMDRDSPIAGVFMAEEQGEPKTQAYRQIKGFPLYIVVGVANSDIAADWRQRLIVHAAYAGLALLATLVVLAVAHRFSRREAQVLAELQQLNASLEDRVRDRTDALERLLKEVTHRVKNSLQLTASMLRLQQAHADKPVAAQLAEAQARVLTVARLHEHLYQAGNFERVEVKRYLGTICTDLAATLPQHRCGFVCTLSARMIPVDMAVPLALIVTELVTNAAKHAFGQHDATRDGTVQVTLADHAEGALLLVEDNGDGLPAGFAPEQARGLGMQIVRGLVGQVEGTLRATNTGRGARFDIVFPLPR